MQENDYIMLLTLTGFSFQYEWLRSGSLRALFLGSAALGLNLLTRVTTGLDLMASGVFLLAVLWFEQVRGRALWPRLVTYCKIAAPVYAFFAIIERLYSFYRFGSLTQTYIPIFARESLRQDPTLPANFPWSTPFSRRRFGRSLQAREINLPVRSSARGRSSAPCTFVETSGRRKSAPTR